MKRNIISVACLMIFVMLFACNVSERKDLSKTDSIPQVQHPNTKTFYKTAPGTDAVVFADTIIYDVVIQNTQYGNDWTNECSYYTVTKKVDVESISNVLFHAVYQKRLIAYDLFTGEAMTVEAVKKLEKKYARTTVAKLEFNEEWIFNETTLEMSKIIKDISLGYEKVDKDGNVLSYAPAFKVYLNNPEKNGVEKELNK